MNERGSPGSARKVLTWEPYTLMAVGILSGLFGQSAFNAGPLSVSLPVIDTVEPVASVILGAAVFDERLAGSPGLFALQLAGGAIAATGIAVLSRSPVTLAEERRESQSASPQVIQTAKPADRLARSKHHGSFWKTLISRTDGGFSAAPDTTGET